MAKTETATMPPATLAEEEIMDVDGEEAAIAQSSSSQQKRLPVTVTRPIPYTFDLGNLLCNDANPLPPTSEITEEVLRSNARDAAQALVNQLLSTCPITRAADDPSPLLSLPAPTTALPREKPVPVEKPLTKWQEFAKRKGISANSTKDKASKMVYDEEKGDWVPKWGYKGRNKEGENDWLVEVDEKKERRTGEAGDVRKEKRAERLDRMKRQERRERANERRGKK